MTPSAKDGWIGGRPGALQIAATLLVGIVGILIPGVQPIVLAGLLSQGHIDLAQMGHAASAELLAMGLAAAFAAALLPPRHLRLISALVALGLALTHWASGAAMGEWVTLLRALAGACGGMLIWVASCLIARSSAPDRWAGIYLTLQTLAQLLVAQLMAAWVEPRWGPQGDFGVLAIAALAASLVALCVPNSFALLPRPAPRADRGVPRLGIIGLSVTFLVLMFIVSIWVYYDPIARQAGLGPEVSSEAVSVSLLCQVLGGVAATVLAGRLRWYPALVACALVDLCLVYLLGVQPSKPLFLLDAALFGFVWLFILPFMVPMLIEADPSRRAAVIIGGVELLGASVGPSVAALLIRPDDATGALWFGTGCLVLCLVMATGLRLALRSSAA